MDLTEFAERGHGAAGALWKAGARAVQDLIFPHHDFDAGSRAASPGLSVKGWSRVTFVEAPACDGCGQPMIMITPQSQR
jgi:hypothetical protein